MESLEARRTRKVVTALAAVALFACVASSSIERRGGGPYAPANERSGGGTLRFIEGTKSRDESYREMYTYCGGQYEITSEREVPLGTRTMYTGNVTTATNVIEHVIDFRCLSQPSGSAPRITGEEWRVARDEVVRETGCASASIEHEVAPTTPGSKAYSIDACGRAWLCSAAGGLAACKPASGVAVPTGPSPTAPSSDSPATPVPPL